MHAHTHKLFFANWSTQFNHKAHAMNMWSDAHQIKFSHLGDAAAYPTHSFHLQQRQKTCYPVLSVPCTHLHDISWGRQPILEVAGWPASGRSALRHRGRRYWLHLLYRRGASSKRPIKPEFQPSQWCKCAPLKNLPRAWYGKFIKLAPKAVAASSGLCVTRNWFFFVK